MRNRQEDKFIQRLEKDIHSKKYQRENEEAIDFKKKIEQLPLEKQREVLSKAAGHAEKKAISVSFYAYPRYEFVGKSTQQLIEEYTSVFDFLHPEVKEEMLEELKKRKAMRK